MRWDRFLFTASAAVLLAACSFTSDGGVTGRIEATSDVTIESAIDSWNSDPIAITSPEGSIEVVGVPGKTNISIHARFVAGANSQADADAAFADLAQVLSVKEKDGVWAVDCPQAAATHGSVVPDSTGCTSLRVEVPAGAAVPLQLSATTAFGGVHVSGVTVKKLDVTAPFGIVADVAPTDEAVVSLIGGELLTGLCSTVLRVPAGTTVEAATLTVSSPSIHYVGVSADDPTYALGAYVEGFENVPPVPPHTGSFNWQRGDAPFDASSIALHASLGKALLTTAPVPAYQPHDECLSFDLQVDAKASAETP